MDLNEQASWIGRRAGRALVARPGVSDIMDAPAGVTWSGFIARDLDGQSQQAYTQITVE